MPWWKLVLKRLPWLVVLLLTQSFGALILNHYNTLIEKHLGQLAGLRAWLMLLAEGSEEVSTASAAHTLPSLVPLPSHLLLFRFCQF
jgi:Mg/Co/Ni transporter MgtE